MQLKHTFTVPAAIDQTWEALNDLERVARCFPGAAIDSVEGDSFAGTVRLKLGPVVMRYVGSGEFVSRDTAQYRAVLKAKGRDRSGNGTADVLVTTQLAALPEGGTRVDVETDLSITGRAAQLGSGAIGDVSNRLLGEFVGRLSEQLGVAQPQAARVVVGESPVSNAAPASGPGPGDTLDLGRLIWPMLIRRAGPFAAGVLLGALGAVLFNALARRRRRP
jgi:carbon monoxide dehydrogenase subunit G